MMPTKGKLIRWLVSAGMLVLLVVFARRVNWHETGASILAADRWPLLLAAVANLLSLALKGVRCGSSFGRWASSRCPSRCARRSPVPV